jgi:Cys-tRNA synthase (O-phospho-L-seryl-tRNA:Cys-tRNA synthase)
LVCSDDVGDDSDNFPIRNWHVNSSTKIVKGHLIRRFFPYKELYYRVLICLELGEQKYFRRVWNI